MSAPKTEAQDLPQGVEEFDLNEWINATPENFDRYPAYMEHVAPLVEQLYAKCREHSLPFFLVVAHQQGKEADAVAQFQHYPSIGSVPASVLMAHQACDVGVDGALKVTAAITTRRHKLSEGAEEGCQCAGCKEANSGGKIGEADQKLRDLMASFPDGLTSDAQMLDELIARADNIRHLAALAEGTVVYAASAEKRAEIRAALEANVPADERLLAAWRNLLTNSIGLPDQGKMAIGRMLMPLVASYLPVEEPQTIH